MRFIFALFSFCLLGFATIAVSGQDDDPIVVDSSVVRLNVGVVNQKGEPITHLTKDNFNVYEDGVKQEIIRFEPVAEPISVVMILDMSGSTLGFRQVIRQSAFRFVDAMSPNDRISVIEFYDKINVLNNFTSDRRAIANSIQVANGRGKTQLYKALEVALDKLAGEGKRRKAIIVLTDGVDTAVRDLDRERLEKVAEDQIATTILPETNPSLIKVLARSDQQGVTIYPLALPTGDPAKLADPTPRQVAMYQAARERLRIIADRSGGTLNAINRLEEMGRLYGLVAADMKTLYTIEYAPINTTRDGKWRAIKIETSNTDLISRTRQGYFAR